MRFTGVFIGALFALGTALGVIAQDATPIIPAPVTSPVAVAEVAPVSTFAIYQGDCTRITGQIAYPFAGDDETGTGAGVLAPWAGGENPIGGLGAIPVEYGEGVLNELNLGELLGGRAASVVVTDGSTGEIVACGAIGGTVKKANHFWQHDRLAIGLRPTGDQQIWGIATFTETTGVLTDKINVSVALVSAA